MDLDTVIIHVDMIGHSGELTPENIRAFAPENSNYKAFLILPFSMLKPLVSRGN